MSTEVEKTISREEAAIHMISGGRCVYAHKSTTSEYFWQDGQFLRCLSDNIEEVVGWLPEGRWKIKRSPIKYSKTIWLAEHPIPANKRLDDQSDTLFIYIFGMRPKWTRERYQACDKQYKITIEEVVD
jgi:hypothetical protein